MIKHTLLMLTIVGSLVWISSCSVEDAVNNLVEQCETTEASTPCDVSYETCVDTEKTSYTFDGNTYECDGILDGCEDALDELNAAIQEYCDNQ